MKNKNAKLIYAQSSDIKARTYIEYRKDMKKKAIAELEIKDWLQEKLKTFFKKDDVSVEKDGGDRFLWFLREGGITREPDFVAHIGKDKELFIEFQYADREDLKYYDFKISKVAKKVKDVRIPHQDRIFLYVVKNSYRYAFIDPKWIVEHGEIGVVPAWGSRQAYRIPKDIFEKILKRDETLKPVVRMIGAKIKILNFQHQLLEFWENELSNELQKVIDEEKLVKIIPKTLGGFFKVCFILDHLNKIPENVNLWLVYLLSYVNTKLTLKEISMLVYSLDYIYSKITVLGDNELKELENKIEALLQTINNYYDEKEGLYKSTIKESPLEETRFALFSINLIEDIIQDAIVYHNAHFQPTVRIYQNVKDPVKVSEALRNEI
ncbi:MAG: hypothetical protein DRG59_12710 [Deltaproteobacteria bacterium]|nr:MAG: hypothetical protein DRG59_12710 [Deltaproteobacteria bacterium]